MELQIKYKALNCSIARVPHGSPEYKGVKKMISTTLEAQLVPSISAVSV
jgi:hypothetical protein